MILIVKGKDYKGLMRKIIAFGSLIIMFAWYYNHMSNQFKAQNAKLAQELKIKNKKLANKRNISRKIERIIFKEAEKCVDLLHQEKIQSIKIEKNKLIITCDFNTNVEPIFIRYGVIALVKSTPENIKIAIDLKYIVESNYEA